VHYAVKYCSHKKVTMETDEKHEDGKTKKKNLRSFFSKWLCLKKQSLQENSFMFSTFPFMNVLCEKFHCSRKLL
jgi:hypothetical protein